MSTLTIKPNSTSEKVSLQNNSRSIKSNQQSIKSNQNPMAQSTMSPPPSSGHRSSDSEVEVVTLPKPRKKVVSKKTLKKKSEMDQTGEAVLAMGGQVIGNKLPVIGPPVLFDESQLRIAFSLLDVNGDGMINCDELMTMLNKLGLKDFINENIVKSLIRDATKDVHAEGDILITEEQFVKWMPRLGLTGNSSSLSSSSPSPSSSFSSTDQGQQFSGRKDSSSSAIRKGSLASSSSTSSYHSASSRTSLDRKSSSSSAVPSSVGSDKKSSVAPSDRKTSNSTITSSRSGSLASSSSVSIPSSRSTSIVDTIDSNYIDTIDDDERKKSLEDDDAEKDLRAAFAVFDQDHNGFITRDELISAMSFLGENLTESDIDKLLMNADTDKDGQINYEEFLQALM